MKTPTEQIKEIEKEINGCQVTYCGSIEKCERCIILHAKLQVLKEWEARENEILEIIEDLKIKTNKNVYDKLSQEQKSWNCVLEELKSKIKGARK